MDSAQAQNISPKEEDILNIVNMSSKTKLPISTHLPEKPVVIRLSEQNFKTGQHNTNLASSSAKRPWKPAASKPPLLSPKPKSAKPEQFNKSDLVKWDKNVLNTLESQGFTAKLNNSFHKKSASHEADSTSCSRVMNMNNICFEDGLQENAKDPALLSVGERKALFERNKGAALLPKAPLGMAIPNQKNKYKAEVLKPKTYNLLKTRTETVTATIETPAIGSIRNSKSAIATKLIALLEHKNCPEAENEHFARHSRNANKAQHVLENGTLENIQGLSDEESHADETTKMLASNSSKTSPKNAEKRIDEAVVQELSAKQEVDENAIKVAQQTGEVTETTPDGDGDEEPGANNSFNNTIGNLRKFRPKPIIATTNNMSLKNYRENDEVNCSTPKKQFEFDIKNDSGKIRSDSESEEDVITPVTRIICNSHKNRAQIKIRKQKVEVLTLTASSVVGHRGFLAMFEYVSGFGVWHRRWCVLRGNILSYWKQEVEERNNKSPIGKIDLNTCITKQVGLVSKTLCVRAHTILLERSSDSQNVNKDKRFLNRTGAGGENIIRHLLSADTKMEAISWMRVLNKNLSFSNDLC